jgi:uncharacterized protein YuzE
VRPGVVLDFEGQGRVVGVEILNVKKQFPEAETNRLMVEMASAS